MKIIVDTTNVNADEETIEVDLDNLGDETLRQLQAYVKKTLQNKANLARLRQYEIS